MTTFAVGTLLDYNSASVWGLGPFTEGHRYKVTSENEDEGYINVTDQDEPQEERIGWGVGRFTPARVRVGDVVVITGDNDVSDPHSLPVGTEVTVEETEGSRVFGRSDVRGWSVYMAPDDFVIKGGVVPVSEPETLESFKIKVRDAAVRAGERTGLTHEILPVLRSLGIEPYPLVTLTVTVLASDEQALRNSLPAGAVVTG